MQIPFVDLRTQYHSIKTEIDRAISNVLDQTAFVGGKYVKQFEADFEKEYGAEHCVSVANGTDAIYIALKMLGIGPENEVITVANSWISTSETIGQTGATPVFVDMEEVYFSIDASKIEDKITERTKAIVPVHLHGQMADIMKIKELCNKHNLYLIEDCAQSHFSEFKGQLAGTIGNVGTFSFYPGKNMGAYGDAGCIITDDDALADRMRMFANHGALKKHAHQIEGINSRLDGLQAAILSVKLRYIRKWTGQRIANAARYTDGLSGIDGLTIPEVRPDTKHSFHLFVVRTSQRDALADHLKGQGISTAIHYPTILPLLPAYDHLGHNASDFPVAYKAQKEILSLPMFPELTVDQIDHVVASVRAFFLE